MMASRMLPETSTGSERCLVNGKVPSPISSRRPDALLFSDKKTKLILKLVFGELCPACEKHLTQVGREVTKLGITNSEDSKVVRKLAYLIIQFIRETEQVAGNLKTFKEEQWHLHAGNVHMEFSRVAYETFKENPNWGRVIMFLGFAVSYSVYLEQGLVVGSADSVLEWTCQVVEEELGPFYTSYGGWEGFGDYLETALKATKRNHFNVRNGLLADSNMDKEDGDGGGSLWHGAFAAGAVAVGAMAALTLRQAFS